MLVYCMKGDHQDVQPGSILQVHQYFPFKSGIADLISIEFRVAT